MHKEYMFEPVGTTLTEYGDGRFELRYARPAETMQQVHEQGEWISGFFHHAFEANTDSSCTLLADLIKLTELHLDDKARKIYADILEDGHFTQIAIVGDAISYTKVLPLLLSLRAKDRIKFFFQFDDARDWLGW